MAFYCENCDEMKKGIKVEICRDCFKASLMNGNLTDNQKWLIETSIAGLALFANEVKNQENKNKIYEMIQYLQSFAKGDEYVNRVESLSNLRSKIE